MDVDALAVTAKHLSIYQLRDHLVHLYFSVPEKCGVWPGNDRHGNDWHAWHIDFDQPMDFTDWIGTVVPRFDALAGCLHHYGVEIGDEIDFSHGMHVPAGEERTLYYLFAWVNRREGSSNVR